MAKGSSSERNVAHLCDVWYKVPAKTFWRSHGSGAWEEEPGDVTSRNLLLTGTLPWMMEVKHVNSLNFLLDVVNSHRRHPVLFSWLAEMTNQRNAWFEKTGVVLIRLLVFRTNHSPDYWIAWCGADLPAPWDICEVHERKCSAMFYVPHATYASPPNKNRLSVLLTSGPVYVTEWKNFTQLFSNPTEDFQRHTRIMDNSYAEVDSDSTIPEPLRQ